MALLQVGGARDTPPMTMEPTAQQEGTTPCRICHGRLLAPVQRRRPHFAAQAVAGGAALRTCWGDGIVSGRVGSPEIRGDQVLQITLGDDTLEGWRRGHGTCSWARLRGLCKNPQRPHGEWTPGLPAPLSPFCTRRRPQRADTARPCREHRVHGVTQSQPQDLPKDAAHRLEDWSTALAAQEYITVNEFPPGKRGQAFTHSGSCEIRGRRSTAHRSPDSEMGESQELSKLTSPCTRPGAGHEHGGGGGPSWAPTAASSESAST